MWFSAEEKIEVLSAMPQELGDMVHQALSLAGVTPSRVETWLGRPCGCEERRRKLNQISAWARRVAAGRVDRAREYLSSLLDE